MFANERLESLPDVPTFKEKGYDVFPYGPLVQMAYVVAPAASPPAVREKLIAMFRKGIQSPQASRPSPRTDGVPCVDDLTGDGADQARVNNVAEALGTWQRSRQE